MLKDRFFYPLAGLVAAAMVFFAMSFGERVDLTDKDIWEKGYVMEGEDRIRLPAQPGTQSVFVAASGGEDAYARLTSTVARSALPTDKPGGFAPLGVD